MSLGVTAVLANPGTPLYTGGSVSADVPDLLPVGIGGREYLVDLREYERATIDVLRQSIDTTKQPGDQSLSTVGIWKTTGMDWRLGAGQPFYDDELANQSRFRLSKGMDIWSSNKLRMHKATALRKSTASSNLQLLAVGARFYVVDGTEVYHTADPAQVSPTWTAAGIQAGEGAVSVNNIASDGKYVYAALGANGIHRNVIGAGTSSHFSAYQATLVAYANGRLLAAKGNEIVEIPASGTASAPLFTHLNPDAQVVAITACPTGIYAAINNGDIGEFIYIGFNAATGALALGVPAGTLNAGETVNQMVYYGQFKAIGTSRGFRLAQIVQDKGLAPGPVIEDFGPVKCVVGRGEYVYFGATNYDAVSTGIARADLSRFPFLPGVPAYATDLMAGVTGSVVQGTVQSVAIFGEKRYFAVVGSGVWGEDTTLVPTATLHQGQIRFGTTEKKVVTTLDFRHEPLDGKVEGGLLHETGILDSCGFSQTASTLSPNSPLACNDTESEFPELVLTFYRDTVDATKGPVLKRWALRAMTVPVRTDVIILPLIVKETVSTMDGEGQDRDYDTLDHFLFLKQLEASRQVVTLQQGDFAEQVVVDQVRVKPEKWTPSRSWFNGLVFVRLLTINPTTGG